MAYPDVGHMVGCPECHEHPAGLCVTHQHELGALGFGSVADEPDRRTAMEVMDEEGAGSCQFCGAVDDCDCTE